MRNGDHRLRLLSRAIRSLASLACLAAPLLVAETAHAGDMDVTPERLVLQPSGLLNGATCQRASFTRPRRGRYASRRRSSSDARRRRSMAPKSRMRVCWTKRWQNGCGSYSTGRRRYCMRAPPADAAPPPRKREWIYSKQ